MAIPFILAGIAVAAGGYGIKKGFDAKSDFNDADSLNKNATEIFEAAEIELNSSRNKAQDSMESLVKLKLEIYKHSIDKFLKYYSKIKNIDFENSLQDVVGLPKMSRADLQDMKKIALEMQEVVSGGITALSSGAIAGMAAYGTVGWIATASTGTAISTLSGAAATNATLAWLGGGSLATGGFGMAGGTAILGGIVAGPVLAVGGMMLASKAEAVKEEAHSNYDKARLAAEEMKNATELTRGIQCRFDEVNSVLFELNQRFMPLLQSLSDLTNKKLGFFASIFSKIFPSTPRINYKSLSKDDQKGIYITASLAITLKQIMEAPLMDKKGSLTSDSIKVIENGKKALKLIDS